MNQIIKLAEMFGAVMAREIGALEKDGIISITGSDKGTTDIHVTDSYFDEHFSGREHSFDDMPAQKMVKVSFKTESGNEIFCLKSAVFERVA